MPRKPKRWPFDWRRWRAKAIPEGASLEEFLQLADTRRLPTERYRIWTLSIWPDRIEVRPAASSRSAGAGPPRTGFKFQRFKTQLAAIRVAKKLAKPQSLLVMVQDLDGRWRPVV